MVGRSFVGIGLLAILSLVSAKDPVVTVFLPVGARAPLYASVIGEDATATTYLVDCAPGTDEIDCAVPTQMTVSSGPKTAGWIMTENHRGKDTTIEIGCSMGGTTAAICTNTQNGYVQSPDGLMTIDKDMIRLVPLTVTAGAITGDSATAATTSEGTNTATGATTGPTSAVTTAATTGDSTAEEPSETASGTSAGETNASAASGTETSTGGMPQVTANAQLIIGGAAMALGAAIL